METLSIMEIMDGKWLEIMNLRCRRSLVAIGGDLEGYHINSNQKEIEF